jgi:hypothetical protein
VNHEALELLEVDVEAARRATGFYMAYGLTCGRESDAANSSSGTTSEQRLMESASAFRKAAAWACLVDDDEAATIMAHAADVYLGLGFGFGAFLSAVAGGSVREHRRVEATAALLSSLDTLLAHQAGSGGPIGRERPDVPEALLHPQQQAYAVLAATARPELRDRSFGMAERSGQMRGVLPTGALGTPIRRVWAVALAIASGDLEAALDHIGAMAQRYSECAESAMSNRRLWQNAHTEFETVDLDIVGFTALVMQRFSRVPVMAEMAGRAEFRSGPALAQLHLAWALVRTTSVDEVDEVE